MRSAIIGFVLALTAVPALAFDLPELPDGLVVPKSAHKQYQLGLAYAERGDNATASTLMFYAIQQIGMSPPWRPYATRVCARAEADHYRPWSEVAGETSDPALQFQAAFAYQYGRDGGYPVEKDDARADRLLRQAADAGNPFAQDLELRRLYMTDREAHLPAEGVARAHKAADQGNFTVAATLAGSYAYGGRLPQDSARAVELFRLAYRHIEADHACWEKRLAAGETQAAYHLARSYLFGPNVPGDQTRADDYLRLAAEAGVADAQTMLGEHLLGFSRLDYDLRDPYQRLSDSERCQQGAMWLERAVSQGHHWAMYDLANLSDRKSGACRPASQSKIFQLYLAAAEDPQHGLAQLQVASDYKAGRGVDKDIVQASAWLEIIMRIQGNEFGIARIAFEDWTALRKDMTPEQKSAARALADVYLATHPHITAPFARFIYPEDE